MAAYVQAVKTELKDWKVSVLVLILTVGRIIYGWSWLKSGWGKLAWFSDGTLNSAEKIHTLVNNIAGPDVTRFDPFSINQGFAWIAQHVFLGMPALTDVLVVVFEIGVGLCLILGVRVFWAALIGTFMNMQFIAGGSFNNFGYIWTNLALMKFAKYAEMIGLEGLLRFKKYDGFDFTVPKEKSLSN
ncbi:DoxX family membrane protein [Candidatus Formimonas warabiya]|uniref:DoxX family protein n=1 Tax=Formimonas warabiya TaxID=1761012 RepID=A0A3G1KME4_FORW1|nr:DoxX family protein [Candidatus Formimonas warabiya]ATW23622.1 DoxX family protein [Candidatus Formimonas warabiya]